jgi:hypothetical protein
MYAIRYQPTTPGWTYKLQLAITTFHLRHPHCHVVTLSLQGNKIADASCLGKALEANKTLAEL